MDRSVKELARIQNWFQTVVTHPDGVAAGIDSPDARRQVDVSAGEVETVILPSASQTSIERLAVYGNAYYARLLECLREEFPAVAHAVGTEAFNGFAFGYVQHRPPRSYTLADLGAAFPRYLQHTRPNPDHDDGTPDWSDFIIDLARLERVYSEVFDGPGVEDVRPLQAEELLRIAPEQWPAVCLQPAPCLRLEEFLFPVHEFATAVRREKKDIALPDPAPTYLAITRRDYIVRRWALSRLQYELLRALVEGAAIADAIAAAVEKCAISDAEFQALAGDLRHWFHEWTSAGFFSSVALKCDSAVE